MEEPKIIVAGHVSLDMTPSFPADRGSRKSLNDWIRPGKLVNVGKAEMAPGGCVTNTGLALHKFGADVTIVAKVGNDAFGRQIMERYRELGVEPKFIVSEEDNTSYTVVIAPPGCDRCFLHDSAANHSFKSSDLDYEEIGKAQYFHFGYPQIMRQFYRNGARELTEMFRRVKELGLVTSLDAVAIDPDGEAAATDWRQALANTLPYVDFFVPSIEELCFMLDRDRYEEWQRRSGDEDICMDLSLEKDVKPLAEEALSMGCRGILLKCGAAGMYLRTSEEEKMAGIPGLSDPAAWSGLSIFEDSYVPDRILSGTGAGDTSIAAFLYGLSHGFGPEECLQMATGTGASCITEYDALTGLLPIEDLMKKIRGGWQKQHFIKE